MKALFQKRDGSGIQTSALILACFMLISVDAYTPWLQFFRQVAGAAMEPVLVISTLPNEAADSFSGFFATRSALKDEIDQLKREILKMQTRTQKMAALLDENNRMRALLGSAERVQEKVLIAEIIGVDPDPNRSRIIVDKGSNDNVSIGQAVIDERGLIGQVVALTLGTSTILLISDQTQAVPVRTLRGGLQIIVEGGGKKTSLVGRHVPITADLQVGDSLVTSGLGQVFPSGYPVAVISQFEPSPGNPFATISAEPLAQLGSRNHVLILFSAAKPTESSSDVKDDVN
ncbi:MAG: rod shape-determining protein MreC [Gammaproteobacteria bacterium]|jgi:rod shape-determining protein MreC|nr:rod shape-determining protein MreC [Gammaproteobacteria bacterium]MBT5203778.1 rod shape-determining protein MreC [Gammaproteobacteria bacterium]MBT5600618.1 rod shape-determining protein MreC [Gammaproteobacteria bacterium]MBT6245124.1 rod shape-determining protein MreC [Gammaproteobacteria bacterium]